MKIIYLSFIFSLLAIYGCDSNAQSIDSGETSFTSESKSFKDYWYQGKAEISSYELEQARYGEVHEGNAVLVFVTEDFSKKKQVKLDNPSAAGNDKVPIMKMNFTKKFNTGIYPYSMMQSTFTPIDRKKNPNSLKTTMSSQEWCGHSFTQLNFNKDQFRVTSLSYFESEGDESFNLQAEWLEDEIWNTIRIAPEKLPKGKVKMIPGSFYLRLRHRDFKVQNAEISLKAEGEEKVYSINYPAEKRTLTIRFQKAFPHKILAWEETYSSGWGAGAGVLTTKAKLKKTIVTDYWNKHNNVDRHLRTELGLE